MNPTFHWINLLILFGALQALIFCVILLFQKKHPGARYLAAFIFVFAYNGFETFNWSSGLNYIFFDLFGFIVIYGLGPGLYLYISTLLYPDRKLPARKVIVHYGLVVFQFVTRIAIIAYHLLSINKIIDSDITSMQLMNVTWRYAEPLSVVVFIGYLVATLHQFRKFRTTTRQKPFTKDRQTVFRWINALLVWMIILGVAWPLTVISPEIFDIPFGSHYYPIELLAVLLTYWIVLNGYHKVKLIALKAPVSIPASLKDAESEKHFNRLQKAMEEEKLFLDPELNLGKLASHVGIPAKMISVILNQHQQTSFNDFINAYRVKEVSERIIDPANQHFTISGMALESGFNSQATFQRVFKNITGMSPREYVSRHLKKTA